MYIRRNPMFAIKDILVILEMSEKSLMLLVRQLTNDNYLKQISGGKVFRERNYKLIKNTGVICPKWVEKQKKLFDENIKAFGPKEPKYTPKESKEIEHRPLEPMDYDKGRIRQILECETEGLDLLSLSERCGIGAGRFAFVLTAMKMDDEVRQISIVGGVPILQLKEAKNDG